MPLNYYSIILKNAKKYNLEPELVCAIIRTESRFRKDIVSKKGAVGLMQIMEKTAHWGAREIGLENFEYSKINQPEINIEIGCWYINNLIEQFEDKESALAAYNAGSGNVSKWLNNSSYSSDNKTLLKIPFPETENYIKKIHRFEKIYKIILIFKKS